MVPPGERLGLDVPDPSRNARRGAFASLLHWYLDVLAAPLRLFAALVRTFTSNRNRLSHIIARERIAMALKVLSVVTVGAWVVIWLLAGEEQRGRLTETVKAYLSSGVESDRSGVNEAPRTDDGRLRQ